MIAFFQNLSENLVKLILSIRWNDIIDIFIVALAIFYILKSFRKTRAKHLVRGIVLLVFVYLIVSAFKLNTSAYIFSRLFNDIVVVLVILFQPEIRHAVESFGRGDFKKVSVFAKNSSVLEESAKRGISNIVKACVSMSQKKVGALIVIEGKSPLGEIISTGSTVDAELNVPVIENIFFPKAPLHDGAMIVRDNRIHSAGCILPLTENNISRDLGTRHRAALGMSENSDALIIVVSEETGAISVAEDSVLDTDISQVELHERLNHFLLGDGFDIKKLKKKKTTGGKNDEGKV